jgi:hypothetical protein
MAMPPRSKHEGERSSSKFNLAAGYSLGYRNREDVTTLPNNVLTAGSQNVLTTVKRTIRNRNGYVLDGQRGTQGRSIVSSYDWQVHSGVERNVRFSWDGTIGRLQYRYDNGTTVTWRDLYSRSGASMMNFAEYWDVNEFHQFLFFVDGATGIYFWDGAVTTVGSTTANTITKAGGSTWAAVGFHSTATYTRQVIINGNTYAYTGGAGTATLTGVTPDPTGEANGSVVHQAVNTIINSSLSGVPTAMTKDLISCLRQQIYLASFTQNAVYVSKVNNPSDYNYTATRLVGEGAYVNLDSTIKAFSAQQSEMYVSAGKDFWYTTKFTLSSDNTKESLDIIRLKTTSQQGALSQGALTKVKNYVAFVSNEPIVNTLGIDANFLQEPRITDLSFPVVNDMNAADLTDCNLLYHKQFLYVTFPRNNAMLIYNMTNPESPYWEAPQTFPFARLAIIGGELYAHHYGIDETFKMFTGYNDDGHDMVASAVFPYDVSGSRDEYKSSDACYFDGYITSNTDITLSIIAGYGSSPKSFTISGTNTKFIRPVVDDTSLGKSPLGYAPLGSTLEDANPVQRLRGIITYPRQTSKAFETALTLTSRGIDQRWEIVALGTNATITTEEPTDIKQ